jgi:hypothetical protein
VADRPAPNELIEHGAKHKAGERNMWMRTISPAMFWLAMTALLVPAHALTQQELVSKLQAAGYSQIGEGKSTPEGISVKAMKDGKEVHLVVDSDGQIKERDQ